MKSSRVLSFITSTTVAAFVLLFTVATAHATYAGKNGRIAFVSNLSGTYQLYTINPDGSDMTQITNLPPTGNALWFPDYSSDGGKIIFSHDMTGAQEMYVINADGTGLTQITHDGLVDIFAHWSPDGQRFVFMSVSLKNGTTVITTMRTDGTDRVVLTDDIPFESYQPEYTPDGKQIVFASQAGGLVSAVWIMNADGSNKKRLTEAPLEAGGPDVSPDARHLAFYSQQNTAKPTAVWVMNMDGSDKRRLTPLGLFAVTPIYSPDGSKILFQGGPLTSPINLYTMNPDGTHVNKIASDLILGGCPVGNCLTPDWGAQP
jgi:Tol biopolymer transport system component